MAQDFEQLLKDQLAKLTGKLQEIAREAVKEDLTRLHHELTDLRSRIAVLERERAQAAAESLQDSF